MKKIKIAAIIICALTIILELLPWGAVLNLMNEPGDPIPYVRMTYSYFSLTPFGYANFSPFMCAILSVVLLILHVICGFAKPKKGAYSAALILNLLALLFSVTPILMFGSSYYSAIGLIITVLLIILYLITYFIQNEYK